MALTIGELVGFLRVDDSGWNQKLGKAEAGFKRVGDKVSNAGQELTTKVTLPLVGAGFAILRTAGNFESSMNRVQAVSGATGDDLAKLEAQAKELGASTAFSASEAADAMYFLSSAGLDVEQTMAALPGVLNLAAAGQLGLADAADIATNILNGYRLGVDQLGRVNDVLAKTSQASAVDVAQVGEAMKFVGPVAAAAGLSFEEVAAAIGLLGNAGIKGSEAGTSLRGAIAALLRPTGAVKEKLGELGVQVLDGQGRMRSLAAIMGDLKAAGATTADMLTIFGQEAGPGMLALLAQGEQGINAFAKELDQSAGTAAKAAAVQMQGLNAGVEGLKGALETLMLAIADSGLLEWATAVVNRFAGWVSELSKTNPELLKLVTIIAAIVAVLGPVLFVIGKIITVLGTAIKVVGKFARALFIMGRATAKAIMWLGRMGLVALRAAGQVALAAGRIMLAAGRMAATMAATAARVIAAWVLMAVQSLLQAARMALAWIIAMGPIGLIIAAVVALVALIIANWETVKKWTVKLWGTVWGAIKKAIGFVKDLFMRFHPLGIIARNWGPIWGFITGLWDRVLRLVKSIPGKIRGRLSGMWNAVKHGLKAALNFAIGLINRAISGLNTLIGIANRLPGVNIPTIGHIPFLARGGDIRRAGLAVVGERGPELLHLPAGASVEPLGRRADRDAMRTLRILLRGDGILRGLREEVQVQGGNVQLVLG